MDVDRELRPRKSAPISMPSSVRIVEEVRGRLPGTNPPVEVVAYVGVTRPPAPKASGPPPAQR